MSKKAQGKKNNQSYDASKRVIYILLIRIFVVFFSTYLNCSERITRASFLASLSEYILPVVSSHNQVKADSTWLAVERLDGGWIGGTAVQLDSHAPLSHTTVQLYIQLNHLTQPLNQIVCSFHYFD